MSVSFNRLPASLPLPLLPFVCVCVSQHSGAHLIARYGLGFFLAPFRSFPAPLQLISDDPRIPTQ